MSVPLTARLDAIPSLAEVAAASLPLGVNAVFTTPEGVLGIARPPRPSRLNFIVDGLPFHAAVSPEEGADGRDGAVCQIWAEVGHIPYSAQSPERRRRLLEALRAIQAVEGLQRARFLVQEGQKILLFSETRVDGHVTPEGLIHETVLLVQEARPFLRILADYI
ncbi:hypothetical protein [Azospirillum halopraeferens]|uniref:hypothetical protein n=1 Tax=Azospirillum halopraeferens TaxID=34010 RepID=UPI000424B02B|nr:hypothetical protein [Azospirillum halopraeferens]